MSWLGNYTVLGDMPVTLPAIQIEQIVAAVLQEVMVVAGYDGASLVTLTSTDPNASVAHPQWPGYQLCTCEVQVIFPDAISSDATEYLLASGLAYYAASLGLPGNLIVTLTGTVEGATISSPTTPAVIGFAASLAAPDISLATGDVI
jgi:hypothetical protein